MPSYHPAMLKPGMVKSAFFRSIHTPIELHPNLKSELEQHGVNIKQVLNKYPNVTQFEIKDWRTGSLGEAKNMPRRIHFIDNDGNGFTLLSRCYGYYCVSKINDYVNYNEGEYINF